MHVIDLTHSLSEKMSVHPAKTPFTKKVRAHYEAGARYDDISLSSGIGTHMDAPSHFYPDGMSIAEIPLEKCFGPACVLHLSLKIKEDADYEISVNDIKKWEIIHGLIPPHALFLAHTGWDRFWGKDKFCSQDGAGMCHFPGFSEAAAKLLVERNVNGVGIDTTGIDPGCKTDGAAHLVFLKKNIFLVEGLANLGKLPPKGAFVYILPMKIQDVPEAPVRAMAILKDAS